MSTQTGQVSTFAIGKDSSTIDTSWYLDSGATNHYILDLNNLMINEPYMGNEQLLMGRGTGLTIQNNGQSHFC